MPPCRTFIVYRDHHINWVMNAASDLLESRMEVQFFDKFNLLGQGTIDRGGGGDQKGE